VSGVVVWLTGLPSSGKSALSTATAAALETAGISHATLDSDQVRDALVPAPAYDAAARDDFYRTLGNLAALLARQGLIVLVPATAHRRAWRAWARAQAPAFVEVHVATSAIECARRDAKGLYARARAGTLAGVPGADVAYEAPEAAEVVAPEGASDAAVTAILAAIAAARGGALPPAA
jgi:adenylylsulfate kinase